MNLSLKREKLKEKAGRMSAERKLMLMFVAFGLFAGFILMTMTAVVGFLLAGSVVVLAVLYELTNIREVGGKIVVDRRDLRVMLWSLITMVSFFGVINSDLYLVGLFLVLLYGIMEFTEKTVRKNREYLYLGLFVIAGSMWLAYNASTLLMFPVVFSVFGFVWLFIPETTRNKLLENLDKKLTREIT